MESILEEKLQSAKLDDMLTVMKNATNMSATDLLNKDLNDIKAIINDSITNKFVEILIQVKKMKEEHDDDEQFANSLANDIGFDIPQVYPTMTIDNPDDSTDVISNEQEEPKPMPEETVLSPHDELKALYAKEEQAKQNRQKVKLKLKVGYTVDIYSASKNLWLEGVIKEIKGDVLCVVYGKKMKWLKKDSQLFVLFNDRLTVMAHKVKAILHKRTPSKADKFEIIVQIKHHDITKSITISLKSENEPISTLKKEIKRQLQIPFHQQELIFKDPQHQNDEIQRLQNDKTFVDYNIKSGNKLKCIFLFSYIICNAQNNTEICRITSDSKALLHKNVLYFKTLIERKLAKKGNIIYAKDQFLVYKNQIMKNDIALNQYLTDKSTANIYLQYDIICDGCKLKENLFIKENKKHEQEINKLTNELQNKIQQEKKMEKSKAKLQSNVIALNYQNHVLREQIENLKEKSQKQKRDIRILATLNKMKNDTTDNKIKKMFEQIERYKQREIENEDTNNIFTMNRLEDYACYFGDNYPMIASIISYYEGIMLMIGMIFAAMNDERNEDECTKSEQLVRWLTFGLFFMIPFIIGVYRVSHENKDKNCKWYERLYQFAHLYTFRIIILFLLLLSCDLKPFSCYIKDEVIFQLIIIVVGIFCVVVHALISQFKNEMHNHEQKVNYVKPIDNDDDNDNGEKEIILETENEIECDISDNMLTHHQVSLSMDTIDINEYIDHW